MDFSNNYSGNCNTFNTFNITNFSIFQTAGTPHQPSGTQNQSSYQPDMFASSSSPTPHSGKDFEQTNTRQGIYRPQPLNNNGGFDALSDPLNFDYPFAASSAPAPAPTLTTGPAQHLSGLPDTDFNLVNTFTPFSATNTSLFPDAGGLQQEAIPPPAYPPPCPAFPPGLQQQQQDASVPLIPTALPQQPLPAFTSNPLTSTSFAPYHPQTTTLPTPTPLTPCNRRPRGRPRTSTQHRAHSSSSSSSPGQLAFHTTVGPAPNNPYQSRSFSKKERRKVAQPHEALLRRWGLTSAEYARIRRSGKDGERELPERMRRDLGLL